ncbi:MAG: two-component sensor histidine kinase, partial [Oscillospiraceae bacterium]|nr:two-component sensor histidine kinase [Oscillospiraceae bacterium]
MIRRLKLKFIVLSMATLLGLLAVIVTGMNIISYNSVIEETDQVLVLLSRNKGRFPEPGKKEEPPVPSHMSPEIPYDSRYFWVLMDDSGNIVQAETSKIKSVSTADAIEFANEIAAKGRDRGFIDIYRYDCFNENGSVRITFLECRRELTNFRNFLWASVLMAAAGYLIAFVVILFFSGLIIKPLAESYDKQKRFITDAGHEIKTPLTIINANAELLEMEYGENECIDDILE